MHAINSGFTVTKIKTMLQITYMCNQCMESVNQYMVIVAHFKTEYKCNTRKCRHMQVLMIAMVIYGSIIFHINKTS
jgi:hypothetical protein